MKQLLIQSYNEDILSRLGFNPHDDLNFVFFWKPRPKEHGVIDASCCCQWWFSKFIFEGIQHPTAEHAMMYGKAKMFNDEMAMTAILQERQPHAVKAIGRQVSNFDGAIWDDKSYKLVRDINYAKFKQDAKLNAWLLSHPANTIFVEASPYDRIWGIGLSENEPIDLTQVENWQGQNKLGFAITEVLQELRNEQEM